MTRPLMEWGVAKITLGGEAESGDSYLVKELPSGVLMAVLDGLGHGKEAAEAARRALAVLHTNATEGIIPLLRRCHEGLRETRGAVLSLVWVNAREESMTWAGVGNVEGLLLRSNLVQPARETLLLRPGVLGDRLPPLRASIFALMKGDTIVLATDGVRHNFGNAVAMNKSPQQIATQILSQFAKGNDDALVLVARYNGQNP